MPETTNEHIPADSVHHGETGARKYVPDPAHSGNLQDGISRGGTVTGDPADSPPKDGYGLTEKVDEVDDKTRKSDGTNV